MATYCILQSCHIAETNLPVAWRESRLENLEPRFLGLDAPDSITGLCVIERTLVLSRQLAKASNKLSADVGRALLEKKSRSEDGSSPGSHVRRARHIQEEAADEANEGPASRAWPEIDYVSKRSAPEGYEKWIHFARENKCHMGSYTRIEKDLEVQQPYPWYSVRCQIYSRICICPKRGGVGGGGLKLSHTGALSAVLKLVVDLIHSSIAVSILCCLVAAGRPQRW